jgi:hypothetical protein
MSLEDRGQVRFGIARELRGALEELRTVQLAKGVFTVKPRLAVDVKFFARHWSGVLRDGVLLPVPPCSLLA